MEFFICKHCGNIITHIYESGVPELCCGEIMQELVAGIDGAPEKHIPQVKIENNIVTVYMSHPMTADNYIQWIAIETTNGNQIIELSCDDEPKAEFALINGAEFIAAHEYCNLHGLWTSK